MPGLGRRNKNACHSVPLQIIGLKPFHTAQRHSARFLVLGPRCFSGVVLLRSVVKSGPSFCCRVIVEKAQQGMSSLEEIDEFEFQFE